MKNSKNRKPYWFITVFEKLEIRKPGLVDTGDKRCMGFFPDKRSAVEALHTNSTDMNDDSLYDYDVMEKYYEGLLGVSTERQFFKYDKEKGGFFEINEPDALKVWIAFSIG